jgi:hypothetical protein
MTYIFRKRENTSGSIIFTEKVEQETSSWPSPGAYLRKSTLVTLARNISGFELPPSLVQDTTFDNREEYSGVFECSPVMLTAQEIIDAMSTSIKAARIEENEGDEGDDAGNSDEGDDQVMCESCSEYFQETRED